MHTNDSLKANLSWQDDLNQDLLKRLTRPLVQPGITERKFPQGLFKRTEKMTGRLPLLAGLLQRWGPAEDLRTGTSRQTFLGPAPRRSATGIFQSWQPNPMYSLGPTVTSGGLTAKPITGKIQRSQTKESGLAPSNQHPVDNLPGSLHHRDDTVGRIADSLSGPIMRLKATAHRPKPPAKTTAVIAQPPEYNRRDADSSQPLLFKKRTPQPRIASKDLPAATPSPTPTPGEPLPSTRRPHSGQEGLADISSSGTLEQKHHAGLAAQQGATREDEMVSPRFPDPDRAVVTPLATPRQLISRTPGQLFLKRSDRQPQAYTGNSGSIMKRGQDTTTARPAKTVANGVVDSAIHSSWPGVSMVQRQQAINRETSSTAAVSNHNLPNAETKPKAASGPAIGLVWRKSSNESRSGNPSPANVQIRPEAISGLNPGPVGDPMLFRAVERRPAERAGFIPDIEERVESTPSPTETGSNGAAGIDLTKIAQRVSRHISRQLAIGLERRGIGRWP
jgi:hypothetical protein